MIFPYLHHHNSENKETDINFYFNAGRCQNNLNY